MIADFQFPSGAEGKEQARLKQARLAQSNRSVAPVPLTGTTGEVVARPAIVARPADLFPDLRPDINPCVDTGMQSLAARGHMSPVVGDCNSRSGAPGVESARAKLSIIDAARRVVVKELIELLGPSVPCARRFQKYLEKQTLADLVARREQVKRESQREFGFNRRDAEAPR